eukprot:CAMPEP_0204519698 /NCGR_PEP_ID=MMETSP0661-20131031/4870_1 /ASSEMBLY_ACC=CAM_ASM_000606 /TAXON_ID=109239 /ORGANISM="Alexandrium margalefi, Strain AMGDE01CS-322" /LENGTH=106 /DNA_ID=CAMNT_0051525209 /DNA_START=40 /DNA_END=358 /DNA_ORIENTATION=+
MPTSAGEGAVSSAPSSGMPASSAGPFSARATRAGGTCPPLVRALSPPARPVRAGHSSQRAAAHPNPWKHACGLVARPVGVPPVWLSPCQGGEATAEGRGMSLRCAR